MCYWKQTYFGSSYWNIARRHWQPGSDHLPTIWLLLYIERTLRRSLVSSASSNAACSTAPTTELSVPMSVEVPSRSSSAMRRFSTSNLNSSTNSVILLNALLLSLHQSPWWVTSTYMLMIAYDPSGSKPFEIIAANDIEQHVEFATHRGGHTLNLIQQVLICRLRYNRSTRRYFQIMQSSSPILVSIYLSIPTTSEWYVVGIVLMSSFMICVIALPVDVTAAFSCYDTTFRSLLHTNCNVFSLPAGLTASEELSNELLIAFECRYHPVRTSDPTISRLLDPLTGRSDTSHAHWCCAWLLSSTSWKLPVCYLRFTSSYRSGRRCSPPADPHNLPAWLLQLPSLPAFPSARSTNFSEFRTPLLVWFFSVALVTISHPHSFSYTYCLSGIESRSNSVSWGTL